MMAKPGGDTAAAKPQPRPLPANESEDSSIANLRKLSDSLSALQGCFTELQQYIDSIRTSIDSIITLPPITTNTATSPPAPASITLPQNTINTATSPVPASIVLPQNTTNTAPAPEPEPESSWESDPSEEEEDEEDEGGEEEEVEGVTSSHDSELKSICETMNGRGLRRYVSMNLTDIKGLIKELPNALKLAPNPGRFVLDCIGKFYSQGKSGYGQKSTLFGTRKAALLILECYLLMGIDEIDKSVRQEAEQAAFAWRKRMHFEGGIHQSHWEDVKGLLLLIGCFGIPAGFRNEYIRDLVLAIQIYKISHVLKRPNALTAKIPEIIEGMIKDEKEVDAVNIAYAFGLEDRFIPQELLTSFLRRSIKSNGKMIEISQGSLAAMNEAKRNYCFALKSVSKCLKQHGIDPSKLLPGWKINERIMSLKKELGVNKRMAKKRKFDGPESSRRFSNIEVKRSRIPPWAVRQQQRVFDHVDSNSTLHGPVSGAYHVDSNSTLHGPVSGAIHEGPRQIGGHPGQLYGWRGDEAAYDLYWPR